MPDIWSLCHSSNVWVVLLSILLTMPVVCAPNPGFVLSLTSLAFTVPCHSCLEHIAEAREYLMRISMALHRSYVWIEILCVFVLRDCHHRSPLGHCRTMKTFNRTMAWGHIGWNTEQFHVFYLLFSGLLQGLHLSRCPRCWKKALQADFIENVRIALDQWSFICCLETYTSSFLQNLTIRTSDNAAGRYACSLACTPCARCFSIVFVS